MRPLKQKGEEGGTEEPWLEPDPAFQARGTSWHPLDSPPPFQMLPRIKKHKDHIDLEVFAISTDMISAQLTNNPSAKPPTRIERSKSVESDDSSKSFEDFPPSNHEWKRQPLIFKQPLTPSDPDNVFRQYTTPGVLRPRAESMRISAETTPRMYLTNSLNDSPFQRTWAPEQVESPHYPNSSSTHIFQAQVAPGQNNSIQHVPTTQPPTMQSIIQMQPAFVQLPPIQSSTPIQTSPIQHISSVQTSPLQHNTLAQSRPILPGPAPAPKILIPPVSSKSKPLIQPDSIETPSVQKQLVIKLRTHFPNKSANSSGSSKMPESKHVTTSLPDTSSSSSPTTDDDYKVKNFGTNEKQQSRRLSRPSAVSTPSSAPKKRQRSPSPNLTNATPPKKRGRKPKKAKYEFTKLTFCATALLYLQLET